MFARNCKVKHALSEGHYFYADILTQGVVLYDSGEYQLATPRELNFCEIEKKAQKYYDKKFASATDFYSILKLRMIEKLIQ